MYIESMSTLRAIGIELDRNQFPRIYNGGFVVPNEAPVFSSTLGKEKESDSPSKRRSTTGPWQGTAGWQRQADRPWPAGRAAPVVSASLRDQYEANLGAVREAYPGSSIWCQREGMWLLIESAVLPGLEKKATFLVAIPFVPELMVRAWGFWTTSISYHWIGPRHTNFPDGSVCAFEPRDRTWVSGDCLVKLLDLYTLWALRHLYLEILGHWPGYQSVPHAYERLQELKDNEFCGCGNSNKRYADCCKSNDLALDQQTIAADFLFNFTRFGLRQPPAVVRRFAFDRGNIPALTDIYS